MKNWVDTQIKLGDSNIVHLELSQGYIALTLYPGLNSNP